MITLKWPFCIIGYQQGIQGIQGASARLPTEGRVHGRGVGDRAGALTLVEAVPLPPVTWRCGETQRDPERPRETENHADFEVCYELLCFVDLLQK